MQPSLAAAAGMLGSGAPTVTPIRVLTDAQADAILDSNDYSFGQRFDPTVPNPGELTQTWKDAKKSMDGWPASFDYLADQVKKAAVYRPEWLDWLFGDGATRSDIHSIYESDLNHLIRYWGTYREFLELRAWVIEKWFRDGAFETEYRAMVPVKGQTWAQDNRKSRINAAKSELAAIQAMAESFGKAFASAEKAKSVIANYPVPESFWDGLKEFLLECARITGRAINFVIETAGRAIGAAVDEATKGTGGLILAGAAIIGLAIVSKR